MIQIDDEDDETITSITSTTLRSSDTFLNNLRIIKLIISRASVMIAIFIQFVVILEEFLISEFRHNKPLIKSI